MIFTFDGDAAGQKAALRAFGGDQKFVGQTYVAVEPDGLDPCDLRLQKGDAAVRELVARRVPLYRFVLANVRHPLRPRPGRRPGRRAARGGQAGLAASATSPRSTRSPASWPAWSASRSRRRGQRYAAPSPAVRGPPRRQGQSRGRAPEHAARARAPQRPAAPRPPRPPVRARARDPQAGPPAPAAIGRFARDLDDNDFTHPTYRGGLGDRRQGRRRRGRRQRPAAGRRGSRGQRDGPGASPRRSTPSRSSRCCRPRSRTPPTSTPTSSGSRS